MWFRPCACGRLEAGAAGRSWLLNERWSTRQVGVSLSELAVLELPVAAAPHMCR